MTSDNDNMEDVCDGNYVRSLPFLQQNTNALQVILSHDDLEIVNPLGVHTKSIRLACSITHWAIYHLCTDHACLQYSYWPLQRSEEMWC